MGRKGVIRRKKGLTLTETEGVCYIFLAQGVYKYTWNRELVGQRSLIDFCFASVNLFSSVVDVRVKRGSKLSTDHYLFVCILRGLNHSRTRNQFRTPKAYRIKLELQAEKKLRHTFATKIAAMFIKLPW